jgi:hypothetical protein
MTPCPGTHAPDPSPSHSSPSSSLSSSSLSSTSSSSIVCLLSFRSAGRFLRRLSASACFSCTLAIYLISRRNSANTFSAAKRTSTFGSARYFLPSARNYKVTHKIPSRNSGSHATSSKSGTESSTINHDIRCILAYGEMT